MDEPERSGKDVTGGRVREIWERCDWGSNPGDLGKMSLVEEPGRSGEDVTGGEPGRSGKDVTGG